VQGSVLVIGGSGMLGRAVQAALRARAIAFDAPPHAQVDVLAPQSVAAALGPHRIVINCSAWTDVDAAEAQEPAATRLNAWAVGELAQTCRRHDATLVHYSTDYVFDGGGSAPYPIDAPINPIGAYGRGKAEGERLIAESQTRGLPALVIRTSWLYAPWGKNFVRTIARFAKEKPSLKVVSDQRGRPTSSEHLADATLRLLDRDARGTFHVTDGGEATWFDFATRIAAFANPACRVDPCATAEFPRPAKRPAYSVLDLSQAQRLIGPMPHWHIALDSVLARLEA